jgi:hypothetical protein
MVKPVLFTKQKTEDKGKDKDKDKELLSKKRQEPDTPNRDVDMVKIKKKVNEIMNSICNTNEKEKNSTDYLYQSMHKNYLLNEFTSNCLNYINKMIIDVRKNHLKKFQGIFELNKLFISIIKELLMNEFELLLLSLYLEPINISLNMDIFTFKESLIYLCYFIKKLTLSTEKLTPINSFLIRKYQGFEDKFNKWFQLNSSVFNNKLYFSYTEINERFKEYNTSYSIYCKSNYIDYNLIIDRILTMSIPYNEGKNENLFVDRKENSSIFILDNNSNNNTNSNNLKIYGQNKNNGNEFLYYNDGYNKNNFSNNINTINNLYNTSYISGYPSGIYLNTNNNNINYDYLYNKNNIIFNINNNNNNVNKNDEKINLQAVKKEILPSKQNESQNESQNKSSVSFKVNNMNKIDSITSNDDKNSIPNNNKHIFIIEEDKKIENDKLDESKIKGDNIKNEISESKNIIENKDKEKQKELSITPNNLLYSLENIDETPPNNKIDNNNIHFNSEDNLYKKEKNNGNNLNKRNEGINLNQNNIIGFQSSQHINGFNGIKYNSNLGVNDFNNLSQGSFTLLRNPYFNEINNLYHNSLHGMDQDDFRQLINQSNENLFRSCFSLNHSSQNFYPILNDVNYAGNNTVETMNVSNLNYQPVSQIIPNNSTPLLNLNNNNYIKNGVNKEKKNDANNNDNNQK